MQAASHAHKHVPNGGHIMTSNLRVRLPFALLTCLSLMPVLSAKAVAASPTPAELSIQRAQQAIAKHPDQSAAYNGLAMALARRARETSDVSYYERAEDALRQSLALSPGNFEAQKIQTWLLLGRHEFTKALEVATRLNKMTPDDVTVYGYLADANAELGNYAAAERSAQWMLNLRPGNVAGLTRGAYLRELYGDLPGAVEFMKMAYDATGFQEFEDRAWILTQIAHIYLLSGDLHNAEVYATGALGVFPNYHYALGTLARVRLAQGRTMEAVTLLKQRYADAPHAENLYELAETVERVGHSTEAQKLYVEFEQKARKESTLPDNANHELIAYYIDHAKNPAEAMRLARLEMARRHDVYTLDCYAWALAANGDYQGANRQIQKALSVGVKDPKILRHARQIADRQQMASAKLTQR
jgi:Flp pilus assembly protein TadD